MTSIKTIALACGVSIATVSKALNDHNDVSEKTRALVLATAKKMGYMPNSQARSLKTNRTHNLGVLFFDELASGLTHSFFAGVLEGFKAEAEKNGYDITFISTNIGSTHMTYYEHCKYRNVDGAIISCVNFDNEYVQELIDSDIPLVTIDYDSGRKPAVMSNNADGMEQLVEYIHSQGHEKIAYIYGDHSAVSTLRLDSYRATLARLNIPLRAEYLLESQYHDPVQTERMTKQLIALPNPPTCIILPDDFSAIGAINAVENLGLSLPRDISIAGYDGILLSQVIKPKLTTIGQDTDLLGKTAAGRLISLIKNEVSTDAPPIIINGRLLKGETVRKLR